VSLFPLRDTYYYVFLSKPNESAFGEIFPRTVHRKEMLSSADADEGRYSATLTFQTIFAIFNFYRCRTFEVIGETSGSPIP
jgi:hypothetical protein